LAADNMDDIVAMQCMLGNLAQHCKFRSLSASQIGIK